MYKYPQHFSTLINGTPLGVSDKGRDPLCPYLFLLAMEVLSKLLYVAELKKKRRQKVLA